MTPDRLRCEHVDTPLAVENQQPRFGWNNIDGRRGTRQTAFQIIVGADRASIEKGIGALWDSGRVRSAAQSGVHYEGSPLSSFTRYYWRVRTWDEAAKPSALSEVARFETGSFAPSDWSAKWITRTKVAAARSDVLKVTEGATVRRRVVASHHAWALYFAKGFEGGHNIERARAYVTGLGYYELSINGKRVGDHLLDPGQTDYATGALYSAYDVDDLIGSGTNVVLFTIANGRHIDAYGYSNPRGFVQILIEYADGTRTMIGTDESWLFSYGPIHENGIYLGELYDARDEKRIALLVESAKRVHDRTAKGSSDENAARVRTAPTAKSTEFAERARPAPLRPQLMAPIRATRELPAVAMTNPNPGVYVYDFGQNIAGVVRLLVSGPRGTRVVLKYAELVGEDGDLHLGTNREAPASDSYLLKGEGIEAYQPRFTYHGFRYVHVSGFPGTPFIESVRAVVVHTDVDQTGSFVCSNPLINKIHENTVWSQRSNLMSVPTDCPQRGERMGWLGDAQLASEEAMCNFDMAAFYAKYLEDIRLSQKRDGSLSDVTPAYWERYPADPAWGTAYVTLAWHMYNTYNDIETLRLHYDAMKKYVDFLRDQSDRHIIRKLGKYGDWCPPGSIFPKQTPIELTSTWYYYHDTLLFARIAKLLGKASDAASYTKRAGEILNAFNREFHKGDGRYATLQMSPIDAAPGQTSQALPLFLDMVPKGKRAAAVEKLVRTIVDKFDSHVDTGIVGTRYIFEVLRDEGHTDLAYQMITQKSYPGWGYMIACGATTIWERWEELRGLGMNSHNHIMLGTVDAWFYRTLAGIIQDAPAWRKVKIEPYFPGDLRHVAASVGTLYGELSVSWMVDEGNVTLDVSVPIGIEATVRIPCGEGRERLLESGRRIEPGRSGSDSYSIVIGSGSYHFERRRQ